MVIANAQNTSGASKVALRNGTVIEGTVTTQGDDIIVTTANGDMFFYSRSEISSITAPRDSNVSRVESSSPSLSFREYKRAAKAAWRDVKTTEFWGDNTTSMDYYQGYRTRKRLSTIFCCSGAAVTFAGIIFAIDYEAEIDELFLSLAPGSALLIAGCVLTAPAKAKLRRSYEYYDNYGKSHAINVSTTPDGRSFSYRNNNSLEFASVDISYNFDSIDVDVDDADDADDADDGNVGKPRLHRKSVATGKSDVDTNIPSSGIVNDKTFAVIVANEKYQSVTEVDCAENDGNMFREYCHKTLGVPEKNIHFVPNATLVNMWAQVDWLESIAKAYDGEASLIFYYAGHGIPDEGTRDAYLLPVDGSGSNVKTGYKLSELYSSLSKFPTRQTVVLLDACFSGAERTGDMLVAARGVALKSKKEVPKGNLIVFSAASGDETAYQYADKGHGLFTYFLLKKLKETKGDVSLGDLAAYVQEQVYRHSVIENSKSQTPTVIPSSELSGDWAALRLTQSVEDN